MERGTPAFANEDVVCAIELIPARFTTGHGGAAGGAGWRRQLGATDSPCGANQSPCPPNLGLSRPYTTHGAHNNNKHTTG